MQMLRILGGPVSRTIGFVSAASLALAGCGGGGSGTLPTPTPSPAPTTTVGGALKYPAYPQASLTVAEVQQIIAQAVGEAKARNLPSIIAVVDRVGNVLALFKMNGARANLVTSKFNTEFNTTISPTVDLEGVTLPAEAGAIAKAVTGAYLSSSGNAFSTRTASAIVQQHFPPAPQTQGLESGPLFGVQFSQLPCSDLNQRFLPGGGPAALIGPKRSPLGLAADPGGMPLYKNGVVVGGIGVMGDGDYGLDPDVTNVDIDAEEYIALAGEQNFAPDPTITGEKISAGGQTLRFSDATVNNLSPLQTSFAAINTVMGVLEALTGYTNGTVIAGSAYGTEASGYRAATSAEFFDTDAFVLTDGSGNNRYPIKGGTDSADVGTALTATEVRAVAEEAFKVMSRERAQIRLPLDSQAQTTVSVIDTYGTLLGLVRGPDAPIFGTDVSLQKARSVAFFSNKVAAAQLQADPDGDVAQFVTRTRTFLNDPTALTGSFSFGNRSIGNLARPFYPDGQLNTANGPLSRPIAQFNPFGVGLQAQLIISNLVQHVGFVLGQSATDTPQQCTNVPNAPNGNKRLANGLQIFAGGVPIYRGNTLVGAIGISGDGIDQDDLSAFLGLNNGGLRVGSIGNAPKAIRADNISVTVNGNPVRLRYVNCPFAPFLDTSAQNVCEGL